MSDAPTTSHPPDAASYYLAQSLLLAHLQVETERARWQHGETDGAGQFSPPADDAWIPLDLETWFQLSAAPERERALVGQAVAFAESVGWIDTRTDDAGTRYARLTPAGEYEARQRLKPNPLRGVF
jgi:hypothetical protein